VRRVEDITEALWGTRVKRESTRVGDLVFFKTGFFDRHVGVYIGMNRFVHSTGDEGVIISNFKDPYWKKTYWQTRRILEF
jgi:lipoprotein Spr